MTQITEHELVDSCRAGRRSAQYELYRRYNGAMFGTCLRMCANREDAEDMLQSSFADVFNKLSYFRGDSTIGAWIKRIVINNCLNHLKRRRLHFAELHEEHTSAAVAEEPEPEFCAQDRSRQVEAVKRCVCQLSDGYRTVLSLYLFEGYDHGEIAQVLDISEQTSKSQYSRARRKLREMLATEYSEP